MYLFVSMYFSCDISNENQVEWERLRKLLFLFDFQDKNVEQNGK